MRLNERGSYRRLQALFESLPLAARARLIPLLPQRSEERPNVVDERRRLFHRGEVAAARHDRPTADVSVGTFGLCMRK